MGWGGLEVGRGMVRLGQGVVGDRVGFMEGWNLSFQKNVNSTLR